MSGLRVTLALMDSILKPLPLKIPAIRAQHVGLVVHQKGHLVFFDLHCSPAPILDDFVKSP